MVPLDALAGPDVIDCLANWLSGWLWLLRSAAFSYCRHRWWSRLRGWWMLAP
jgi:hypothetical protein